MKPFPVVALLLTLGPGGCTPRCSQPSADPPPPPLPTITLRDKPGDQAFVVSGLPGRMVDWLRGFKGPPERWVACYWVRVAGPRGSANPALLGDYRVVGDTLEFVPRYPLQKGVTYEASFHLIGVMGEPDIPHITPVRQKFTIPKPDPGPPAVVEQVFPTRATLPENQLKFYLVFSAPMSRGEAYRHIHLFREDGKEVDLPFLELGEELWDAGGRRLTLFFDPGRIKRGLKPREEVGPAIEEGKSYTLVIGKDWPDAEGNPLKDAYRKSFRVGPPDETCPNPKSWKVSPPAAGTRDSLTVRFPEPLDRGMLERVIEVRSARGGRVAGTVTVGDEETCWRLTPKEPWQAGAYELVVDTALEDLGGNSIARPFEVDVFRPISANEASATVTIPFRIEPAGASR